MTKQDAFADWLSEFGLARGTIECYVRDLRLAGGTGPGLLERLRNDKLAPKTRRKTLAAARRWADFTENARLTEQLKRLRLPPARRRTAKIPVERAQLFAIVDELAKADYLTPVMRGVIGMMACRGLRCGDALRLKRTEIADARASGILAFEVKGARRIEFKILKTYRRYLVLLDEAKGEGERIADLVAPGGHDDDEARMRAASKAVERALAKVAVRAGVLALYPHRLRRTYAVQYLRSRKGDPEALVHLTQHMQWASMATAMEYVDHARGAELDDAAERIFDRDQDGE